MHNRQRNKIGLLPIIVVHGGLGCDLSSTQPVMCGNRAGVQHNAEDGEAILRADRRSAAFRLN